MKSSNLNPILLIEDSARDVELTIAALEEFQLANPVIVARDGADALDYLYRRGAHAGRNGANPVLVLLDLKLPKVDGFEVLRQIKGDPDLMHTPVVMLTSSAEECDLVRSYKLGVNAYVTKPVGFDDFFRAIQDLGMFWGVLNKVPLATPTPGPQIS